MNEFIQALENLQKAQEELSECKESCEYEAGYYCSTQYNEVEKCEQAFELVFTNTIDRRFEQLGLKTK